MSKFLIEQSKNYGDYVQNLEFGLYIIAVAPCVGAWVEIPPCPRPPPRPWVAPYVGAWIKMIVGVTGILLSLPTWERGLKCVRIRARVVEVHRSPNVEHGLKLLTAHSMSGIYKITFRVEVRIEINLNRNVSRRLVSHFLHGSVD